MREAADKEDSIEKLPVTPGPIVPAREQLGELLLEQGHPEQAASAVRLRCTRLRTSLTLVFGNFTNLP